MSEIKMMMSIQDEILLKDRISEIDKKFVKDGWITIYDSNDDRKNQVLIYCCLVDNNHLAKYMENSSWNITAGAEGKPSVWSGGGSIEAYTYQTYSNEGIEPFIFSKSFKYDGGHERYVDISEEFVLYYKFYERLENKQNRTYYLIDDSGELHEAIIIRPKLVKVKLKYLIEYLAIRKFHLSICFDFMRFSELSISELEIKTIDENTVTEDKYYNHFIRPLGFIDPFKTQSWIHGKTLIGPPENFDLKLHFEGESQFEEFIVGYDDNHGAEILLDCSKTTEKYFIMTFFKKEVLNKYFNEPTKYKVDGMTLSSDFFSLKMDNNHEAYVMVFLVELRMLPHKEQLHWKQYNIVPQAGMSQTYYRTMIEGNWAETPQIPDLFFKHQYGEFNKKWLEKFGWYFYKPLNDKIIYRFTALHVPTTNNIKEFCEQILSIVILTIDSINEKEIEKGIDIKDAKGIGKLEAFLQHNNVDMPDMIVFLKRLQNLRSGLVAHRFSIKNKDLQKSMNYFNMTDDNYIEVATDIFIKSIHTLNSLERNFLC